MCPYGLCNAEASYQHLMDICLSGLPADHILVYIDDVAVFSRSFREHLRDLESVFLWLQSAGISLRASKCLVASQTVDFLGYELSSDGIKPQKKLTDAIGDFQRPETKKKLKQFLGLTGFYRNFKLSIGSPAKIPCWNGMMHVKQPFPCLKNSYAQKQPLHSHIVEKHLLSKLTLVTLP